MTDSIHSISQVNRVLNSTELGKIFPGENARMRQGEVVVAKIVEKEGEHISLDIGGKIIKAKQEGATELFVGMTSEFEVLQSDSDLIILKAHHAELSEIENKLSNLVKKEISDLGIELNSKNIKILLAMHGNKIPISAKNVQEIGNLVNSLKVDLLETGIGELLEFLDQHLSEDAKAKLLELNSSQLLELVQSEEFNQESFDSKTQVGQEQKSEGSSKALQELKNLLTQETLNELKELGQEGLNRLKELVQKLDMNLKESALFSKNSLEGALSKLVDLNAPKLEALIDGVAFLKSSNIEVSADNLLFVGGLNQGDSGLLKEVEHYLSQALSEFETSQDDILSENSKAIDLKQVLNALFSEDESALDRALDKSSSFNDKNKELVKSAIILLAGKPELLNSKDVLMQKLSDFLNFTKQLEQTQTKAQDLVEGQKEVLGNLKNMTGILSENQNFIGMIIPNFIAEQKSEIELYVNKESARNKNKDSTVVYLALNTHHLDNVRVRIEHKKESLKVDIMCKKEEAKTLFEKDAGRLKSSISKIYPHSLKIDVHTLSDDMSFAQFQKKENLVKLTGFGIDTKI